MRKKVTINRLIFIGVLAIVAVYYLIWAAGLKFNGNPDELMRYLIPKYIYNHGNLPTGYDKEAVYQLGNWSYAFYPQMLGGVLSAFFMKLSAIFTTKYLVLAARLTSVLAGVVTVAFVGLTLHKIKKDFRLTILGMLLIAFVPQFTYLSSYVNNDIIAVCGVSVIMYALYSGCSTGERWDVRKTILLALGMIICTLGYLNSMGFVLIGGLCFLFSLYRQHKADRISKKQAVALALALILIVTVVCLPFYLRNALIYHGDLFGMKTFHAQYAKWLQHGGAVLQHPYLGQGSLGQFLTDTNFWLTTQKSFIAYFGYLTVPAGTMIYLFYLVIFSAGIIGYCMKPFVDGNRSDALPNWGMVIGGVITIALFMYYALFVDIQPQGRYVMEILPFFIVVESICLSKINDAIFKTSRPLWILMGIYIVINLYCLVEKVYPLLIR